MARLTVTQTNPDDQLPGLVITRMETARDELQVQTLLTAQRRWAADVGIDVSAAQYRSNSDYADPGAYYAAPHGAILLARSDQRPVGMVGLKRLVGMTCTVEVRRLFVAPDARGYGLGRTLVERVLALAGKLGYDHAVLKTTPSLMPTAWELYRSLGFEELDAQWLSTRPGVVALHRFLSHAECA